MKKVVTTLSLLALAGTLGSHTARADVTWEHGGKVTIGDKKPETVLNFYMRNVWKGQRQRSSVFVDASVLEKMAPAGAMSEIPMAGGAPKKGEVVMVQRLDDDRILGWSPQARQYIDEPLRSLPKRLRLNVWEKLDPSISATDIPQLTPEQRARLGAEVRAAVSPITKKLTRFYFRPLPEKRVINGMNSHGYRLTAMINGGSEGWVRISSEWWLADEMPGDEEVRSFVQSAFQIKKEVGGPTASMWLNEIPYVVLAAFPKEFHQAWHSFVGEQSTTSYGFQGTPVQFFLTVTPPPVARMMTGDIRLTVELKKRDTTAVDDTLFDAPKDYKRVEIEPFLKMAENGMKMAQDELQKKMEEGVDQGLGRAGSLGAGL